MINFNFLRSFYHVANNLSFTLAARDLFITQPAVTRQVKLLEEYWGLRLFDKVRGKIYLTAEGNKLYEYAKKIFQYEQEIESAVKEIKELKQGVLRLAISTYVPPFMSFLTDMFIKKYPNIVVELNATPAKERINTLITGKSDISIFPKVEEHPDIHFILYKRAEIVLIVNPDHFFAKNGIASLNELSAERIILREMGSGTRKVVDDFFMRNHITPNILLETGDTESIKRLVEKDGLGISFLIKEVVTKEIEQGSIVEIPLKNHKFFLDVYIAYLKNRSLSLPAKSFLSLLAELGQLPKNSTVFLDS